LRTTIGEPLLSEVVEKYRAMGVEVHVELIEPGSATNEGPASGTASCNTVNKVDARHSWGSVYVRHERPASSREALNKAPQKGEAN